MCKKRAINEAEILQYDEVKMPPVQMTDESFVFMVSGFRTKR